MPEAGGVTESRSELESDTSLSPKLKLNLGLGRGAPKRRSCPVGHCDVQPLKKKKKSFALSVRLSSGEKECFGVHGVAVNLLFFLSFEVVLVVGLDEVDRCGVSEKRTVDVPGERSRAPGAQVDDPTTAKAEDSGTAGQQRARSSHRGGSGHAHAPGEGEGVVCGLPSEAVSAGARAWGWRAPRPICLLGILP